MELKEKEIKLNRELSELDKFALEFLSILKKYTDYVIISGYVAILLGRTRATDDIDVFIKPISKPKTRAISHRFKAFKRELSQLIQVFQIRYWLV